MRVWLGSQTFYLLFSKLLLAFLVANEIISDETKKI